MQQAAAAHRARALSCFRVGRRLLVSHITTGWAPSGAGAQLANGRAPQGARLNFATGCALSGGNARLDVAVHVDGDVHVVVVVHEHRAAGLRARIT